MSSKTSSVYIDLTETVSQSDSDSVEHSDSDRGNNGNESDQLCASDCCIVISDSEDER